MGPHRAEPGPPWVRFPAPHIPRRRLAPRATPPGPVGRSDTPGPLGGARATPGSGTQPAPFVLCLGLRPRVFRGCRGRGAGGRAGAESETISGGARLCWDSGGPAPDTVSDLRPHRVCPPPLRAAARPPPPRVPGRLPRRSGRHGPGRGCGTLGEPQASSSPTSRETEAAAARQGAGGPSLVLPPRARPCKGQGGRSVEKGAGVSAPFAEGWPRAVGLAGQVTLLPVSGCPPWGDGCVLPFPARTEEPGAEAMGGFVGLSPDPGRGMGVRSGCPRGSWEVRRGGRCGTTGCGHML